MDLRLQSMLKRTERNILLGGMTRYASLGRNETRSMEQSEEPTKRFWGLDLERSRKNLTFDREEFERGGSKRETCQGKVPIN